VAFKQKVDVSSFMNITVDMAALICDSI
jgi:hypothetical protein